MVCCCRCAAEEKSVPGASTDGPESSPQRTDSGKETRQAVAAKTSAARGLARKLAEEKQAAVTAANLAAEQAMDERLHDR